MMQVMMMVEMLLSQQMRVHQSLLTTVLPYCDYTWDYTVGLLTMSSLGFFFFVGLTEDRSTGIYKSRRVLYS